MRGPIPGEFVGDSEILHCLGSREGCRIWSVRCACGRLQIRTTGQINYTQRFGKGFRCIGCLRLRYRDKLVGTIEVRSQLRLERVLEGGPVWTDEETCLLQEQVMDDLEAEFGALDRDAGMTPGDLHIHYEFTGECEPLMFLESEYFEGDRKDLSELAPEVRRFHHRMRRERQRAYERGE